MKLHVQYYAYNYVATVAMDPEGLIPGGYTTLEMVEGLLMLLDLGKGT